MNLKWRCTVSEESKSQQGPERRSVENLGVDPVAVAEAVSGIVDVVGAADNNVGAIADGVSQALPSARPMANQAKSDIGKAANVASEAAKPLTAAHVSIVEQLSKRSARQSK